MSSTTEDYLFWKLSTLGARHVLCRTQSPPFSDPIHRNRLTHIDITHHHPTPSPTSLGVFVVAPGPADLAACFNFGRQHLPNRPLAFIQMLDPAEASRSVAEVAPGLRFVAATVLGAAAAGAAAAQIDSVLGAMLYENGPVYIGVVASSGGMAPTGRFGVGPGQVHAASAAVAMAFLR